MPGVKTALLVYVEGDADVAQALRDAVELDRTSTGCRWPGSAGRTEPDTLHRSHRRPIAQPSTLDVEFQVEQVADIFRGCLVDQDSRGGHRWKQIRL